MTTLIRTLGMGALAVVTLAGAATAQPAAPLLNTLEVRKLVASAEPAAHARLADHFAALAVQHDAGARRHSAIAAASVANPNRGTGAGMREHCDRLAKLEAESAATLRELAAHHTSLAAGQASTAPEGGRRFEEGAGAPDPTEAELTALAARASTPADHRALQEYFLTLAARYTAEANDHRGIAMSYRGTRIAQAADHCERVVANAVAAAKEATTAAAMHGQLAAAAR
ncbi:MAG: hypothetical protein FJW14_10050 [Acidimicrobiia bacterium]|nr:hypothetical protein [Acidimicrobiia bacterium]